MFRSGVWIVALAAGLTALASAQQAQDSVSEAAVRKVEERWINNEYNPAALREILANDFIHVLPTGMITKADQIAYVRTHPAPHYAVHRFEKLTIRVLGNVAIATGDVLSQTQNGGPAKQTYFTDVFALRAGRWQAVNSQENQAQ